MPDLWTLHVAQSVARFIYTLPRGQATSVRDALAVLRTNSQPEGVKQLVVEEPPNLYEVKLRLYRIRYQVLIQERVSRILFVG
jgi:mRNA-degrading endonuclease RelE of RelBE toxin-antitoxin system